MKGFTVSSRPSLPRVRSAYARRGAIAPTMIVALVLAAIAALFVAVFFAQTRPAKEVDAAQAASAESLYAEGLALQSSDPEVARAKFLESAAKFAALAEETDAAGFYYNEGNALFQAGRLGGAIASYHAADRRMPGDRSVLANLAEARTKVLRVTELPPPTALERWTAMWSAVGQFTRSLLATILLWAAVFCALFGRRRIAVIAAVIGVCCAATVALDLARRDSDTRAVLERPTSLRKGNGDGFELTIAEPLPAGTECRVLEARPGWVEIECSPTVFGWVKDDTILRVR